MTEQNPSLTPDAEAPPVAPSPVSSRAWLKFAIVAVISIAIGAVGAAVFLGRQQAAPATQAQAQRYHCPMHPTYTSDKPGDCPICGMKLVPMEDPGAGAATAEPGERKVAFYRSPMDPTIRSDKPAKDSMGMDFVPVYEDEGDAPPSSVAGRAVVTISSERRQVLGVRSEEVRKMPLAHRIRTVGKVAVDERLLRQVRTKVEGYIEHLYVDYTGQFVKRGERLLSIFSPDLVATQQEYLLALRGRNRLSESAVPSAAEGSSSLLEAARQRLLLWDIRPADIEKLERTGQVTRTLNVYSEIGGYVMQKMAYQGMKVTPADALYEIADLSRVWVLADVYEYNLSSVTLGMQGVITVASIPGKEWTGKISFISPTVEGPTRTVKVRLEVDNTRGDLKPEMFADVSLDTNLGTALFVPETAIIDAGARKIAFVDLGEGRYEPREVTLGGRAERGFVVLSGLEAGEKVVVAANFLIDSESSLQAVVQSMKSSSTDPSATPAPAANPHAHH
jgi:multidrug efflux pump subunit AcrA (membrane-fusion protein)